MVGVEVAPDHNAFNGWHCLSDYVMDGRLVSTDNCMRSPFRGFLFSDLNLGPSDDSDRRTAPVEARRTPRGLGYRPKEERRAYPTRRSLAKAQP